MSKKLMISIRMLIIQKNNKIMIKVKNILRDFVQKKVFLIPDNQVNRNLKLNLAAYSKIN